MSRGRVGLYGLLKTAESMVYLLSGVIRGLNRCPRSDTLLLMALTGYKPHSTLLPSMSQKSFIELTSEDPSFTGLIPRVREYVEFKGMVWCIAAMVHGLLDTIPIMQVNVLYSQGWVYVVDELVMA